MLINVDPLNPSGRPDIERLTFRGYTGVVLVSRPGADEYAAQVMGAGLMVLAVLAQESAGYMVTADVYQIGNEPDGTGPSSWARTPAEYREDWNIYRNTYPDFTMISAALVSGDPSWWRNLHAHDPSLEGCSGMAIHPYGKTAADAAELFEDYRTVQHDLARMEYPIWVTEWNRPDNEVAEYAAMLRREAVMSGWFCASDGMVSGFGITPTARRQLRGCV